MKNIKLLITFLLNFIIIFSLLGCDESANKTTANNSISTPTTTPTLQTTKSSPKTSLEIVKGWKHEIKGDYIYVRGSVKNTGDTNITYFEVTSKFLDDNNNVLDSDYTNSIKAIAPGEQQEFEISHRYNSKYSKINVFVNKTN